MSFRQQIYDEIRHDIITCVLAPGEPLSENQFVERFQVSKTPIREALTSLVQDGLLEYIPNRGFMVTGISIKDIQEIFEARMVCETAMFRLALKYISDADVDRVEALSKTGGGAGRMAAETSESPQQLREEVTSKGGTTAAAMQVLEAAGVRAIFADAITAAARRSAELARQFGSH